MLDALKRELKDFVGSSRHDEVFRRLKADVLRSSNCELYNDTVVIQSRHSDSLRAGNLGTIDFREKNLQFNNVSHALVWLIERISVADLRDDLKQKSQQHVAIPEYHAYTCDRSDQNEQFQLYNLEQPKKIHHFYLYGDTRQSHESLHERLGRDLGYQLLNWEEGDYESGVKVLFRTLKPAVHRMGEPGTGKTEIAWWAVEHLNALTGGFHPEVLVFNTKTTSKASDLFYTYDALSHFRAANMRGERAAPTENFISNSPN